LILEASAGKRVYSGATIRPALRGARLKFKRGWGGLCSPMKQTILRSLHIYIIENKYVFS
jgi:hypothetical protein